MSFLTDSIFKKSLFAGETRLTCGLYPAAFSQYIDMPLAMVGAHHDYSRWAQFRRWILRCDVASLRCAAVDEYLSDQQNSAEN